MKLFTWLSRHETVPAVPDVHWTTVEAPKVAQLLAEHALKDAQQLAEQMAEIGTKSRDLRIHNGFGYGLEIAMQRKNS